MNSSPPQEGYVRSLTRRLESIPAPLNLFAVLTNNGQNPNTVLLESAEPSSRKTQRSLLVTSAALRVTCRGGLVEIVALNSNGQSLLPFLRSTTAQFHHRDKLDGFELVFARASDELSDDERLHAPSPLSVLRSIATRIQLEAASLPEAILLVGVFAYDLVAQFESLPESTDSATSPGNDVPDYEFLLADQMIVIDHLKQHAEAIVNVFGGQNADSNYYSALNAISKITETAQQLAIQPKAELAFPHSRSNALADVATNADDATFAATVAAMKEHIVAGDVFQIVPSRTFSIACRDPLMAYASLRQLNPSPYLFYVNFGEFALFGASPESAVKVDGKRRTVEISPIAGTRSRGLKPDGTLDADLDSRIEAELRLDEKENAEHMMLVDLARNDVARVAKSGTRQVVDLARVDRYSHVMHLVSRVQGILRDDLDALHAYQASMNMGTLTGAPKIRAMQLIRKFEGTRRGHYGGAVGYVRGDGSLDTAIIIRSALVQNGMAHVRAGAGVVHDSVPQLEADETRRKAEAVLRAITRANALFVGDARHG